MSIKKLTIASSIIMTTLSSMPFTAKAEPADTRLISVTQADGSKINICRWGDEFSHGWETEEGYSVIKDEKTGLWFFAEQDGNGDLVSSSQRVKKGEKRAKSKALRRSGKAKQRNQQRRKQAHNKNVFSREHIDGNGAVNGGHASTLSKTSIQGTINVIKLC
ncbi:hypothetical protein [Litorilituus sediminis]|uniref:Uncharacterized protein n=1 Tax=Litorilituus sediminis TaxID=718192 RepID=A0A4P6PC63_9GAMM|nr:hypothetical protein [Litorilituus sediminis]QBG37335.1 hypothetical protein EMK97_17115 [Litorilituus sediminis]